MCGLPVARAPPRSQATHPRSDCSDCHPQSPSLCVPQKNAVYYVAKQFSKPCSPEEFGLALARHFIKHYPQTVWKAKVLGEP